MQDPLPDYNELAPHSLNEDKDEESAEVALNPQPNIHPIHPRTAPFLFPTLADLPGLLVSSIGSAFRTSQLQHLRTRLIWTNINDNLLSAPPDDYNFGRELNETWSEFAKRIEANPNFSDVRTLDALQQLDYEWPGTHEHQNDILANLDGIHEEQIITSELDAFITSHQQDKSSKISSEVDDSLRADESKLLVYRCGVYFVLFPLIFIVVGNLIGAIYLFMSG